jgi:hypothetical protein
MTCRDVLRSHVLHVREMTVDEVTFMFRRPIRQRPGGLILKEYVVERGAVGCGDPRLP